MTTTQTEQIAAETPLTGTCPVCNGTKRVVSSSPCGHVLTGHDATTATVPCRNCGGQQMWGAPTGIVQLRSDGTPCRHEYRGSQRGNCYWVYRCIHCTDAYAIDSGD